MTNDACGHASVSAESAERPRRIGCPGCNQPLPLRLSQEGERAALWECDACQTRVAGMFVPELATHLAHRVRLGQVHFDAHHSPPIPPVFGELVSRWIRRHDTRGNGPERRRDDRYAVHLEAVVVGLNDQWVPQGRPARALVVDLSRGGLGMVVRSPIKTPLVAVQIEGRTGALQLLGSITWSDHVGSGMHHVGARFVHRLGRGI